jgi:hypothetical protein
MGCCEHANKPVSLCSLLIYCNHLYNKIQKANEICAVISSSVYVGLSQWCAGKYLTTGSLSKKNPVYMYVNLL